MNVDCDMHSNNSETVRDALCFFMDEEKGHEIAYVQYQQNFVGVTKNDLYGSDLRVIAEVGSKNNMECYRVLTLISKVILNLMCHNLNCALAGILRGRWLWGPIVYWIGLLS